MIQFPPPPPDMGDIPPPGPMYQFLACLLLVLLGVELLLGILPKAWQRKVNQIRSAPAGKGGPAHLANWLEESET